jgi:signal transduction histidine kinase
MTVGFYRWTMHLVIQEAARPNLRSLVTGGELARCEADPVAWRMDGPGRAKTWAYGLDGRSSNPDAPALAEGDVARAVVVDVGDLDVDMRGFFRGGVALMRPSSAGPCAVAASVWTPALRAQRVVLIAIALGGSLGVGGSLVVALAGIAPLTRRIARVRRAAGKVGEETGYEPAEPEAEDDLGQVSAELDRAHARLRAYAARVEAGRRDLQRHLANVAHDLKTPITSLQLSMEQAIRVKNDPVQLDRVLTGAVRDLVYLGALTSNLRLATELEEGWSPATGAVSPLADAVTRATTRVRLLARRNGISLDVAVPDGPVPVACDPTAAERAVANVVENAVIHGARGRVAVVLGATASGFELTVLDDGTGVAEDEIPQLGERTFRADGARRRDARGSGLGLAITREICARCGWTLGFAHEESGQGFRVSIAGRLAAAA